MRQCVQKMKPCSLLSLSVIHTQVKGKKKEYVPFAYCWGTNTFSPVDQMSITELVCWPDRSDPVEHPWHWVHPACHTEVLALEISMGCSWHSGRILCCRQDLVQCCMQLMLWTAYAHAGVGPARVLQTACTLCQPHRLHAQWAPGPVCAIHCTGDWFSYKHCMLHRGLILLHTPCSALLDWPCTLALGWISPRSSTQAGPSHITCALFPDPGIVVHAG